MEKIINFLFWTLLIFGHIELHGNLWVPEFIFGTYGIIDIR